MLLLVAFLFMLVPSLVLAQVAPGAGAPPLATFHGFDLTPILGAVISLAFAGITYLVNRIRKSTEQANLAAVAAGKTASAQIKLAELGASLLGKAWDGLSPMAQRILADGKVTAEERQELEAYAMRLLREATSEAELRELADALGLPLSGIAAKVASFFLGKWTASHDPTVTTESARQFPIAEPEPVGSLGG